jgi:hypothetical protein
VQAAPQPTTAASVNWVAYENADKGFQAAFPGGQPQPIDPLAEIKDESQRELAAAMTKEMMLVGVTHGGRRYLLNAMPFDLGGLPPASYLDRMSAGIEVVHQGFSVEPQPPADASAPQRDYVLKKGDAGKLLRVVVGRGHLYQLLIEGEAGLGFGDPAAKEFFGRFQCAAAASAAVASIPADSGTEAAIAKSEPTPPPAETPPEAAPAAIEWHSAQGKQIAFTIDFPGVTPARADPLAPLPERVRLTLKANQEQGGLVIESLSAEGGGRRYFITAFRLPDLPAEESRKLIGQMVTLTSDYVRYAYPADRGRGYSAGEPVAKWQQWTTTSHTPEDGGKAIVRQAQLGPYGFVVRVEGPAGMDDLDPLALQFINSLRPPEDTAAVPTDTKPPARPSAKTKTKLKKKSK